MVSNFYAPEYNTLSYLWFLQVLAQSIIVIGIVFSVSKLRQLAKNHLWLTSILLLIIFSLICFTINTVWATDYLQFRLPYIYLPLFLVGWCTYLARSKNQKIIALIFSFLLFSRMYACGIWPVASYIWLILGSVMLIATPKLRIFRLVKPMVIEIAAAAYILYLTHQFILHFIWHITQNAQLRFVVLLAICFVITKFFYFRLNFYQKKCNWNFIFS